MASLTVRHSTDGVPSSVWTRNSIQSSPTLARVHRATLRLEGLLPSPAARGSYSSNHVAPPNGSQEATSLRADECQLGSPPPAGHALKRGSLLTLHQGTLFRRWKERYFLLTQDYLSCFKIAASGPTPMGPFLYKVRLAEVRNVLWSNSRSDAQGTVTVEVGSPLSSCGDEQHIAKVRHGSEPCSCVHLRSPTGIKDTVLEDWFELIEECVELSKSRRAARTASVGKRVQPTKP